MGALFTHLGVPMMLGGGLAALQSSTWNRLTPQGEKKNQIGHAGALAGGLAGALGTARALQYGGVGSSAMGLGTMLGAGAGGLYGRRMARKLVKSPYEDV